MSAADSGMWTIEMGIGRNCTVDWTWANFGHRHPFGVDVWPDGRNIPFWITCDGELCGFVMLSPGSNPEELVKVSRFGSPTTSSMAAASSPAASR